MLPSVMSGRVGGAASLFHDPRRCRRVQVLDPVRGSARPIRLILALGHNAFQTHAAGVAEPLYPPSWLRPSCQSRLTISRRSLIAPRNEFPTPTISKVF